MTSSAGVPSQIIARSWTTVRPLGFSPQMQSPPFVSLSLTQLARTHRPRGLERPVGADPVRRARDPVRPVDRGPAAGRSARGAGAGRLRRLRRPRADPPGCQRLPRRPGFGDRPAGNPLWGVPPWGVPPWGVRRGESRRGESRRGESGRGESGRGESGRGESGRGESGRGESGRGESGRGAAGPVVAILGAAGKSGSLSAAAARAAGAAAIIGVVPSDAEAALLHDSGLADAIVLADARDPVAWPRRSPARAAPPT